MYKLSKDIESRISSEPNYIFGTQLESNSKIFCNEAIMERNILQKLFRLLLDL